MQQNVATPFAGVAPVAMHVRPNGASPFVQAMKCAYAVPADETCAHAPASTSCVQGPIASGPASGEGGTVTVDRERDLALSAQALGAVEEIDHALAKLDSGTYGICENCGRTILKARLEALPYARLCIDCKSGGLSKR